MFENILNWKLLSGSHKFPGPDGGTCINEAAIVAAGFKYRAVRSLADCPPCFSRVIASYTIRLNDEMPDGLRQELLMPFVTRLASTADTDAKEIERARHIAIQTIKRTLPISLQVIGLDDHARRCAEGDNLDARAAAKAARAAEAAAHAVAEAAAHAAAEAGLRVAIWAAADADARAAVSAATAARTVARVAAAVGAAADAARAYAYANGGARAAAYAAEAAMAADDYAAVKGIFQTAVAILDEAIGLGNQAEPIETAFVVSRMEAIKRRAFENA